MTNEFSSSSRIRHIDAWRFVAVSLVIFSHFFMRLIEGEYLLAYPFLRRFGRIGEFGVLVFFVISGFVICKGLRRELESGAGANLRGFYIRRCFRILPPLWLYLGLLVALSIAGDINASLLQIGRSAMFLCNLPLDGGCSWYAGHTWSLAYEEQFYIAFPVLLSVFAFGRMSLLFTLLPILFAIASLILRIVDVVLVANYLMYASFLLVGCAAALHEEFILQLSRRLSVHVWIKLGGLVALSVLILPYPLDAYAKTIFYSPAIAILVLGTPVHSISVARVFDNALISHLGRISYSVYLWQQLAVAPPFDVGPWGIALLLCIVWLFAYLSWRFFEAPLIKIAAQLSARIK